MPNCGSRRPSPRQCAWPKARLAKARLAKSQDRGRRTRAISRDAANSGCVSPMNLVQEGSRREARMTKAAGVAGFAKGIDATRAQKLRRADPEAAICATGGRPLGAKQGR